MVFECFGSGFESMQFIVSKNSPTLQRGFPNVNLIISVKELDVTVMCCSYENLNVKVIVLR